MVLRQQLDSKEGVISDLQKRDADLRATVSSLNSENANQQLLLQHHKEQQQLITVLQRDAANAAALQSAFDHLQSTARQSEDSLQLLRTRVAAAECETEGVRAMLSAAEERVTSLKMALKAQADAAAVSVATATTSAVANTRAEMIQEIALLNQQHASQVRLQQHQQLRQKTQGTTHLIVGA